MNFSKLFKASNITPLKKMRSRQTTACFSTTQFATEIMQSSIVDFGFFKKTLALHYQHLYASKKWHNGLYRMLFFGFGALFLFFGIIIFSKTVNYTFGFYFTDCLYVKNSVNMICVFLSSAAFLAG